jgi:hypothetical protein
MNTLHGTSAGIRKTRHLTHNVNEISHNIRYKFTNYQYVSSVPSNLKDKVAMLSSCYIWNQRDPMITDHNLDKDKGAVPASELSGKTALLGEANQSAAG